MRQRLFVDGAALSHYCFLVVPRFEFTLAARQLGLKFGELLELVFQEWSIGKCLTEARLERWKAPLVGFKVRPGISEIDVQIANRGLDPAYHSARPRFLGNLEFVLLSIVLHRDHSAEIGPSLCIYGLVACEFQADAVEYAQYPAGSRAVRPHPVRIAENAFPGGFAIGDHRAVTIEYDLIDLRGSTTRDVRLQSGDLLLAALDLACSATITESGRRQL